MPSPWSHLAGKCLSSDLSSGLELARSIFSLMGFQFPVLRRPLLVMGWGWGAPPSALLSLTPSLPPILGIQGMPPPHSSLILSPPFPPHLGGRGGEVGWLRAGDWGGKRRPSHWGHWTEEKVTGQSKGSQITLFQGPHKPSQTGTKSQECQMGAGEGGFCCCSAGRS